MFARRFHSNLTLALCAALTLAPAVRAALPPDEGHPAQGIILRVPRPDFAITQVYGKVEGGQDKAYVLVRNYGNAAAVPSSIMVQDYAGGQWVAKNCAYPTNPIPAGGQGWCVMNVSLPVNAPGHILRFTVDFWNAIAESNENNNWYQVDNVPK